MVFSDNSFNIATPPRKEKKMEIYEINIEYFKKCLRAVSHEPTRYYISGVYIHDEDGIRHYVGTNGHILVHCKEKCTGDTPLEKGIIVRPTTALDQKRCLPYVPLKIYDETTTILHMNKRILCDIIDGQFPNYKRVIPTEVEPEKEYVAMDPEYLLLMKRILGTCTIRPLSSGPNEPHIFRKGDEIEVVIMPMRI